MSHLTYSSYPGFGHRVLETTHYSQSVLLPPNAPTLTISGQGGWNRDTMAISPDLATEILQAFENVDVALKDVGGKGMEQVYKLVVYYAPAYWAEPSGKLVAALKKWFPEHKPLLTAVGVERLALEGMRVEVEAYAHLG